MRTYVDDESVSATVLTICGTRPKPQCIESLLRIDTFCTPVVDMLDTEGKQPLVDAGPASGDGRS